MKKVERIKLTTDVENPHPDRRSKRDWTKFPVLKQGTTFVVTSAEVEYPWHPTPLTQLTITKENDVGYRYVQRTGNHDTDPLVGLILDNSKPLKERGMTILKRYSLEQIPDIVIDQLWEMGKFTEEDIEYIDSITADES